MAQPLRLLLVEDNPIDADLVVMALERAGFAPEWQRVENEADFRAQLSPDLELILSDYCLPQFGALEALELLRASGLAIPFIIVSGTIGEETAVAAMKQGASDYLLKDRLARLGQAIDHALEQNRLRLEQVQAKEELERSREDFRLLFASNPMPMWVYELATLRFLAVNEAAVAHYGYTEAEFLGMTILDLQPAEDQAALLESVAAQPPGLDCAGVGRHRTRSGRQVLVEITSYPIRFRGCAAKLVLAKDVTKQREDEAALLESEARFRQVVENIREVFWMTDVTKNRMLYVSPGFAEIWGRTCEALMQAPGLWLDAVHPADRKRVSAAADRDQVAGAYDETYRILRPDGSIRWIRDRAFPVRDARGEVVRIVGVAEDVTERKNLETQILRAQRMQAIGTLAGGIAHDLNNILAPMLMVAGLLDESVTTPRDREMLQMVERSARRGAEIIRQLLAFSRGIEGERTVIQPRHVMREVASMIRETFPRQIVVEESAPSDLWPVLGDSTQLHQVLVNLCVNARDAMPEGGVLTLSAGNVELDDREAAKRKTRAGGYVVLEVSDTGTGIAPEVYERMFDPFFSTKDVGRGTGLGLSTVMGIVTGHGGFVTVDTTVGRGSVFRVSLPAVRDPTGEQQPQERPHLLRGAGELILVVDDEPEIREATRRVLEQHDYRVVTAANGREALAVFARQRDAVRLVLTDVMMPEMGGGGLVCALRAAKPELRFVATSGLEATERHQDFAGLEGTEILAKPCSPQELLECLRRRLDGAA